MTYLADSRIYILLCILYLSMAQCLCVPRSVHPPIFSQGRHSLFSQLFLLNGKPLYEHSSKSVLTHTHTLDSSPTKASSRAHNIEGQVHWIRSTHCASTFRLAEAVARKRPVTFTVQTFCIFIAAQIAHPVVGQHRNFLAHVKEEKIDLKLFVCVSCPSSLKHSRELALLKLVLWEVGHFNDVSTELASVQCLFSEFAYLMRIKTHKATTA